MWHGIGTENRLDINSRSSIIYVVFRKALQKFKKIVKRKTFNINDPFWNEVVDKNEIIF